MKERKQRRFLNIGTGVGAVALAGALVVTMAEPTAAATAVGAVATTNQHVALTPNQIGGGVLPTGHRELVFTIANGNWAKDISLPAQAQNNDKITVRSTAAWPSVVRPDSLLHASTMTVTAGDEYVFRFLVDSERGANKWLIESAPARSVPVTSTVPTPTSPRTVMTLQNGRWFPTITLPTTAGDRDFVRIRSSATWPAQINSAGVEASGPLTITTGQEYTFLYVAEKAKWVALSSPETTHNASSLTSGVVPTLTSPRTRVTFGNGNWVPTLALPSGQPIGSRVIVTSTAAWAFDVKGDSMTERITTGETVSFIVRDSTRWERETVTIDLLLLYSEKAATQFTEKTMHTRLTEGLTLTNEALENSGANFRFRAVGMRKLNTPDSWTTLNHALGDLRTHTQAQTWRNETKADGIYYEGTEDGCGLAYLGADAHHMVATGSTNCGTTVMRHELGHNMGAHHAKSNSTAQGYEAIRSIMGGNDIPYFSTPHRYDPKTGMSLGIENKIDAVRGMNATSATKATFR